MIRIATEDKVFEFDIDPEGLRVSKRIRTESIPLPFSQDTVESVGISPSEIEVSFALIDRGWQEGVKVLGIEEKINQMMNFLEFAKDKVVLIQIGKLEFEGILTEFSFSDFFFASGSVISVKCTLRLVEVRK